MSKQKNSSAFMPILYRAAGVFALLDLFFTALFFAVIVPMRETPLSDILSGGIAIGHRAVMLVISLLVAGIWVSILRKKGALLSPSPILAYFHQAALTYLAQITVLICIHGFYLVTYYNEYIGIPSPLLRGPSFTLSFAALLFALVFPFLQKLLQSKKLPTLPRLSLHCMLCILLAYLSYVLFADAFASASSFLILCAVFVLCYILIAVLYFRFHSLKIQSENDATRYTPLYQTEENASGKTTKTKF